MRQAALNDGYNVTGLTATASQLCECYPDTSVVNLVGCFRIAGVDRLIEFVQVDTSATVNCLIKYTGIPASYSLSGSAKMRVAQ